MISVCIATYNGEKYILKQIKSILSQLSFEDEIIISDNDSTDNTVNIVRGINDSRIKIYIKKQNKIKSYWNKYYNVTANFENAINKSIGDIIMLCDQDDIWNENKVYTIKKDLEKKDCVFSNYSMIDQYDNIILSHKYTTNPLNNPIKSILFPPFSGCTMAIKRSFLKYCLPFPKKLLLHDVYIGLIAYITNNIYFEIKPLTYYRSHDDNVSTTSHGKTRNNIFQIITWRIKLYYFVLFAVLCF